MFKRFLIRCQNEKCKKVLLRENPAVKFMISNPNQLTASDVDTGEIMVMPNHYCKHCKHKNLFTVADCVETSGKTVLERQLLAKKIHEELTVIEKRILVDSEKEGDDVEDVAISDIEVTFKKPKNKGKDKNTSKILDETENLADLTEDF